MYHYVQYGFYILISDMDTFECNCYINLHFCSHLGEFFSVLHEFAANFFPWIFCIHFFTFYLFFVLYTYAYYVFMTFSF